MEAGTGSRRTALRTAEGALAGLCALMMATGTATAATIDCSTPLTTNLTLTATTGCANPGQGLVVGADNITINLNGFGFDSEFGDVISSTGHSDLTIENGGLFTQGVAISLTDATGTHIDNVQASGEIDGLSMTGGSGNTVTASTLSNGLGSPLAAALTSERHDTITDTTISSPVGAGDYGEVTLAKSTGTVISHDKLASVNLSGSNLDVLYADTFGPASGNFPQGIGGTGNANLIVDNVIAASEITLSGKLNVLYGNTAP